MTKIQTGVIMLSVLVADAAHLLPRSLGRLDINTIARILKVGPDVEVLRKLF